MHQSHTTGVRFVGEFAWKIMFDSRFLFGHLRFGSLFIGSVQICFRFSLGLTTCGLLDLNFGNLIVCLGQFVLVRFIFSFRFRFGISSVVSLGRFGLVCTFGSDFFCFGSYLSWFRFVLVLVSL